MNDKNVMRLSFSQHARKTDSATGEQHHEHTFVEVTQGLALSHQALSNAFRSTPSPSALMIEGRRPPTLSRRMIAIPPIPASMRSVAITAYSDASRRLSPHCDRLHKLFASLRSSSINKRRVDFLP